MENENTYQDQIRFININGQLEVATERNIKMTYTLIRERRLWRFVVRYERVRLAKTARARVVYFGYNNRIARFKRAVVPAVRHRLAGIGISITIAQ